MNDLENFDLKTDHIDAEAVKLVDENFIHTRKVFPYKMNDKRGLCCNGGYTGYINNCSIKDKI